MSGFYVKVKYTLKTEYNVSIPIILSALNASFILTLFQIEIYV